MCQWLTRLFQSGRDKPSPSDIVPETSIEVKQSRDELQVHIDLMRLNISLVNQPKVWIPPIPDTNSMDPGFDYGHNNILIAGADEADHGRLLNFLKAGDIAVYEIDASRPIIHRIVEIGTDGQGRFFRFQGDNCASKDPYQVRDAQIRWLCIGTIF